MGLWEVNCTNGCLDLKPGLFDQSPGSLSHRHTFSSPKSCPQNSMDKEGNSISGCLVVKEGSFMDRLHLKDLRMNETLLLGEWRTGKGIFNSGNGISQGRREAGQAGRAAMERSNWRERWSGALG